MKKDKMLKNIIFFNYTIIELSHEKRALVLYGSKSLKGTCVANLWLFIWSLL